ncbi:MAG TPA: hypothetical protein VF035_06490 [Longimicrobiales bacterium]
MSQADSTPESGARRELSDFLLEFGVALNRHAIYPAGHPSLRDSERQVLERLRPLMSTRPSVSIGVARRQLVIEGVATDEGHPVLRAVAERLHRQHVGAVTLSSGVTEEELRSVLRLIAVEAEQRAEPLGLGAAEALRAWPHIRLYPMTYDQLALVPDEEGDGGPPTEDGAAAQLWLGLARAAVALESSPGSSAGDEAEPAELGVETVARAINEHPAAPAYDQVIVGHLLQLASQLRGTGGSTQSPVSHRVSKLITQLEPDTLSRLLEMGGDARQRRAFVMNATDSLATDAVLDMVKAAASTSHQTISSSMLRMLTKLSANAGGARGAASSEAMREQVRELIADWELEDPNPDQYTEALDRMSQSKSASWSAVDTVPDVGGAAAYPAEPLRIVQMSLEVDVTGVAFFRAARKVMAEEPLSLLLDLLDATPPGNAAAAALWEQLDSADTIGSLLTTDPVDFQTLDRVLARLPDSTVTSLLLDRISESASRATRMGVFQRLSARGDDVLSAIVERLADERWFVRRNMLALLNEIGRVPPGFTALPYASDPEPSVRREALQLAVNNVLERERAICLALGDRDERTVLAGARAAQGGLPASAVPFALRCVEAQTLPPELRAQVVRVLRGVRSPAVLDVLLRSVVVGRSLLGRPKLARPAPDVIAAVGVLASTWRDDPRAAAVLDRARSGDSDAMKHAAETA